MQFRKNLLAASVAILASSQAQSALITAKTGEDIHIFNAPTGKTLVLKHVATKSQLRYSADLHYDGPDLITVNGIIGTMNLLYMAVSGSPIATVQEAYTPDVFGDLNRTVSRVTSIGSSITVDTSDGTIKGMAGYDMGSITTTRRIPGVTYMGSMATRNVRMSLIDSGISADMTGRSEAIGTIPARDYSQMNAPIWTYDSVIGPSKVPVQALLSSADPVSALKNAGFLIWSTSSDRVTFNAVYTFKNLRFTETGKNWWTQSLALTQPMSNSIQMTSQEIGIGDIVVSVMFSVPKKTN